MGKQGRVMHRMAAVGAGVLLAGSMWTGTAAAAAPAPVPAQATGGLQCTLIPTLFSQFTMLSQGIPVPGLPTGTTADSLAAQLNALIPGCASTSGASSSVSNPAYPAHNPTPVGCYPSYKEGYPDHPNFDMGYLTSAPAPASAGSSSGSSTNPAGLTGLGGLGLGATDSATGQGLPVKLPAAAGGAPQAAPQAYAAQPQQAYVAGAQQPASYGGYGNPYQPAPYNTSGAGAQGMNSATPYGDSSGFDQSFGGYGGYGPPPAYGDDYGYGHDGYKNDRRDKDDCYGRGKESSPKSYGKDDDHGHDYGQVSHVPDGSVNTGDGSTVPAGLVERTTG